MNAVVVLGAGPAGLLASIGAAEAGHHVTLLEAADHTGGMSASFDVAGQRVDLGSHRLHPATDPALMERLQRLLGPDLQARERKGRIRLRDRWVGFPLRTVDMARSLPLGFTARVAIDTAMGPIRRSSPTTFEAAVIDRLGPTVFREFYEPYAQKLYGVEAADLHVELADRRIAATSPLHVVAKVLRATRSDGRLFWYPKNGYGQIVDRLTDAAREAGVDLRLSTRATSLNTTLGTGCVVTAGNVEINARAVLSTIPQTALASITTPAPPPQVEGALAALRTRAMVVVYLVVPKPQYTPFDAHYFPETDISICRLSEPKNYRDSDDPGSQTVLCAELACWAGDSTWLATDKELGDLVVSDLVRAGLPVPKIANVETRRLPHVYPVFERATMADRAMVHEWVEGLDHVLSFGRQGLGVPDNLHHVLAMASAAVHALDDDGTISSERWCRSLREFSEHVVQD